MGQQGKMSKALQRWMKTVGHEYDEQAEGEKDGEGRKERERTYGIKHRGLDDYSLPGMSKPQNGCLRTPEAYILARGDIIRVKSQKPGCGVTTDRFTMIMASGQYYQKRRKFAMAAGIVHRRVSELKLSFVNSE
eukprot:6212762-Pleurochrysis_carterae.AAC.3